MHAAALAAGGLVALAAGLEMDVGRAGPAASLGWSVTSLGTAGGTGSQAVDVNDYGDVVGFIDTALAGENPSQHAFLWSGRSGTSVMRDLGTLPLGGGSDMPNWSVASAINERGQVIGVSHMDATGVEDHAFLWFRGSMRDLGCRRPRCELGSVARALNEHGQIVGYIGEGVSAGPELGAQAVLWANGKTRSLGTFGKGRSSQAVGINDRGQIVGNSYSVFDMYPERSRAFLWQNGAIRDLGLLPGEKASAAVAINSRGQVIGRSRSATSTATRPYRGFLWQGGVMRDLGEMRPVALNDRGQVVGVRRVDGRDQSLLWDSGKLTRLPFDVSQSTHAINNRGQIVGSLTDAAASSPVLWRKGTLVRLPRLAGDSLGAAVAVNERGQVVGWSGRPDAVDSYRVNAQALLWTPR